MPKFAIFLPKNRNSRQRQFQFMVLGQKEKILEDENAMLKKELMQMKTQMSLLAQNQDDLTTTLVKKDVQVRCMKEV